MLHLRQCCPFAAGRVDAHGALREDQGAVEVLAALGDCEGAADALRGGTQVPRARCHQGQAHARPRIARIESVRALKGAFGLGVAVRAKQEPTAKVRATRHAVSRNKLAGCEDLNR